MYRALASKFLGVFKLVGFTFSVRWGLGFWREGLGFRGLVEKRLAAD